MDENGRVAKRLDEDYGHSHDGIGDTGSQV